jgi:hypothetical protein
MALQRMTLTEAVVSHCHGLYRIKRLGPYSLVRGQSFTYLQQSLRLDGWRGITYSNLTYLIEHSGGLLGFDRGRGRRVFHGGVMKFGNECDVVYIRASRSDVSDEQLDREAADEQAANHF